MKFDFELNQPSCNIDIDSVRLFSLHHIFYIHLFFSPYTIPFCLISPFHIYPYLLYPFLTLPNYNCHYQSTQMYALASRQSVSSVSRPVTCLSLCSDGVRVATASANDDKVR